ncbi:MAG: BamA/TamA family outer membrane protein, partial [Bacteroidetes bacterium]|nr:BamA/TamA family outer membrane protein [Bacteroidota bacterium]
MKSWCFLRFFFEVKEVKSFNFAFEIDCMRVKVKKYTFIWWGILILISLWGCKATRHLEPGQVLLQSDPKIQSQKKIPSSVLYGATKYRDNRRMLWPKAALYAHNFGKSIEKRERKKDPKNYQPGGFVRWLQYRIGEPPVVIDTLQIHEDTLNLHKQCFSYGYFHPYIDYKIDTLGRLFSKKKKRKARVTYIVREGIPYKLNKIELVSPTPNQGNELMEGHYQKDKSYLIHGENYSHSKFLQERARATALLRDNGYFSFSPKMIAFSVDTNVVGNDLGNQGVLPQEKWVNVEIQLDSAPPKFTVRNIDVYISPVKKSEFTLLADTLHLDAKKMTAALRDSLGLPEKKFSSENEIGFHLTDPALLKILDLEFISQRVHLKKGRYYQQTKARRTQQMLQELGMFQYLVISYDVNQEKAFMDVIIELRMAQKYQLKGGFESFTNIITSTNLPGVGVNVSIRDKNALHKSEFLQLGFRGDIGFYAGDNGSGQFDQLYYKLGADANLHFHRFLFVKPVLFMVPPRLKQNLSRFSPSTALSAQFSRESLQEYERLTTGFDATYRWNHIPFSDKAVSSLTPMAATLIIINPDSLYRDTTISRLPPTIRRDFENRFSTRLKYSYTHQDYRQTRAEPTYWYRISVEWGGNLPYFLDNIDGLSRSDNSNTDNLFLDSLYYGQYVKGSLEGKLFIPAGRRSEVVMRGIIGASTPYNHTPTVPQESRFFSGSTNSMRGWQSNTLGPGTSQLTDFQGADPSVVSNLIAPGGEIIFEANLEYRFDVFSYLEMAVFTDVGNVWFTPNKRNELVSTALFRKENLKLGWDAGVGFRFDFSFLILRVDIGQQIFAPDLDKGWVIGNDDAKGRRTQLNLG